MILPQAHCEDVLVLFLDLVTKSGRLPESEIESEFGHVLNIVDGETLQQWQFLSSKSISSRHLCHDEGLILRHVSELSSTLRVFTTITRKVLKPGSGNSKE